ncbi:hypothetical protein L1049_003277 [Liquidambar formosana]|uniref:HMG box domain-containing protein n=1 Tax=Liquidambar formosana TaxID=63359 RepID=A0AAP0NH68_LIQFO
MQSDGNLVAYPVNSTAAPEDAYWSSNTLGISATLNLNRRGLLGFRNSAGLNVRTVANGTSYSGESDTVIHRTTLDADGVFRLYSHSFRIGDEITQQRHAVGTRKEKVATPAASSLNKAAVVTLASDRWRSMSKEDKALYEDIAAKNRADYYADFPPKSQRKTAKLVEHFDTAHCCLNFGNGQVYPISLDDVEFVMGISATKADVPKVGASDEVNHLRQKYNAMKTGVPYLVLVSDFRSGDSGDRFCRLFILYFLGILLFHVSS